MPTEPVRERIVAHVADALTAINGTGQYHTAVVTVDRGQLPPSNLDRLPHVRVSEGEETDVADMPIGRLTATLPITVRGWVRVEEQDAPLPTAVNRLVADIARAVMADPTRGGNAQSTTVIGRVVHDDDEPDTTGSGSVIFAIHYRTLRTDPATV